MSAPAGGDQTPSRNDIASRSLGRQRETSVADLKRFIVGRIQVANLRLTPDGDAAIDRVIDSAASRYSGDRRDEAEKNAARYGDAIVSAASDRGTREVTAAIVSAAASICPLWPFC
jgi:hypothetical protein